MPADGRSILLVAQLAPPSPLIAARRVAGMTKYLARLGHSVTVLTSAISGEGPIEGAKAVIRTRDLMASGLNWRRGHFDALTGGAGVYRPPSPLASVVVPDVAVIGWLPFALRAALQTVGRQAVDCVITSSPPQSAHVIGHRLRRRGIPWIAELRDGWTFEPPREEWPLPLQRRLDEALERRLLGNADAIVGVTEPIAQDAAARFGQEVRVITNGFDPDEPVAKGAELLAPGKRSFVYTGRASVAARPLEPLLEAVRLLVRESPALADGLELVFAGPLSADEAAALADPALDGIVRSVGPLDRPQVLGLQHQADGLIVLTRNARSEATGKLFEYLAAGQPILVVGERTEAARIVEAAHAGIAVPLTDPRAIAVGLRSLLDDPPHPDEGAIQRYAYPRLAAQLGELIESVCERR